MNKRVLRDMMIDLLGIDMRINKYLDIVNLFIYRYFNNTKNVFMTNNNGLITIDIHKDISIDDEEIEFVGLLTNSMSVYEVEVNINYVDHTLYNLVYSHGFDPLKYNDVMGFEGGRLKIELKDINNKTNIDLIRDYIDGYMNYISKYPSLLLNTNTNYDSINGIIYTKHSIYSEPVIKHKFIFDISNANKDIITKKILLISHRVKDADNKKALEFFKYISCYKYYIFLFINDGCLYAFSNETNCVKVDFNSDDFGLSKLVEKDS